MNRMDFRFRAALAALFLLTGLGPAQASEDPAAAGKEIFDQHCHLCHALPNPADYTVEMWQEKVAAMAPFAQLDPSDTASLKAYVEANAGRFDDILASERGIFVEACGSCHDPDNPPSDERDLNGLRSFLIDHMIEQTDEEPEDHTVHEAAEYLLHRQLVPATAAK